MRTALDPQALRTSPLLELPDVVAGTGYERMELSPREDLIERAGDLLTMLAAIRDLASRHGLPAETSPSAS